MYLKGIYRLRRCDRIDHQFNSNNIIQKIFGRFHSHRSIQKSSYFIDRRF